jgi:lantibiotic modifying enzyme
VELTEDADTLTDLNEAMQITAASCTNVVFPASGSLCLCHGVGGNADLLLAASDMYGRRDLRQIAESVGHQAISQIQAPNLPWPCGVTTGGETPNLMLGLAGIGHFFLRLYDSEKIPSILLLRPQHARKPQAKAESTGVHASIQREHV